MTATFVAEGGGLRVRRPLKSSIAADSRICCSYSNLSGPIPLAAPL